MGTRRNFKMLSLAKPHLCHLSNTNPWLHIQFLEVNKASQINKWYQKSKQRLECFIILQVHKAMWSAQTITNSTILREGIWSSSQQINHIVFFHSTFTFAYSRCLLIYVNSKEYKAPQLANTRVKKPHFYFATRACEVVEMWSLNIAPFVD